MKHFFFLLFALSLFITGCSNADPVAMVTKIEAAKEELFGKGKQTFDKTKAAELVTSYQEFVDAFPDDEKTPEYMFKQAEILRTLQRFDEAIGVWEKIYTKYPKYAKAPQSYFLVAFTYENELKNLGKAKKFYETFLEKYPSHEFAKDAKFSLDNLGVSPEDIIKSFQKKKQPQS